MGHNNYFQFKQFLIRQNKSAMRVGTDGVLLGSWTNVSNSRFILDIGTGTGLLALMLAQRTDALITGVEIEANAADEAKENVQNSPWPERITIKHKSFQEFAEQTNIRFDTIVSNPPFFNNAVKSLHPEKSIARHNHFLTFTDLLSGLAKTLTPDGKLSLILPAKEAIEFAELAINYGFFPTRLLEIKPSPLKATNRHLMEFTKKEASPTVEMLSIFKENGVEYSDEYKQLTVDYYLNF